MNNDVMGATSGGVTAFEETVVTNDPGLPRALVEKSGAPELDIGIADFLRRDVLLYSALWSATFTQVKIDPWALMLNNVALKAKIGTFAGFRGNLHVRMDVNGTPSHYGRLLIAYQPHLNTVTPYALEAAPKVDSLIQLPNVQLDPTTCQPCSMVLPYLNNIDWIDLTTSTGAQLGVLWITELNALEMMSSATPTDVRVRIYGHFENVELMGATEAAIATFAAQSGEYSKKGMISRPLTALSNAAGALVSVPFIGDYARATQTAAGVGAKFFSLFGFSKPTNMEPPMVMRTNVYDSFGPLSGFDYSKKLSADPKKELAIGDGGSGLELGDELAYGSMCRRWGLISIVSWAPTDTPTTPLGTYGVTPTYIRDDGNFPDPVYYPSPLHSVCLMNAYWSGSLEFKIDIVASAFHKGRLRILYDPQSTPGVPTVTNVVSSYVIDIADTRSVCIRVPWNQPNPWNRTFTLVPSADTFVSFAVAAHTDLVTNGVLRIFPDNELSSTLSTQGAYLNVYMRAGDDFQLALPHTTQLTNIQVQSGSLCVTMGKSPPPLGDRRGIYMGEDNQSLRSIFKRPCPWRNIPIMNSDSVTNRVMEFPMEPHCAGVTTYEQPIKDVYGAATDTAFVYTTPFAYFRPAFVGVRGNQRWKVLFNRPDKLAYCEAFFDGPFNGSNSWTPYPVTDAPRDFNPITLASTSEVAAHGLLRAGATVLSLARMYPALGDPVEFEVPDYNTVKFHVNPGSTIGTTRGDFRTKGYLRFKTNLDAAPATLATEAMLFHSVGEDFNFVCFSYFRPYKVVMTAHSAQPSAVQAPLTS